LNGPRADLLEQAFEQRLAAGVDADRRNDFKVEDVEPALFKLECLARDNVRFETLE
jgi:hypothetical protein